MSRLEEIIKSNIDQLDSKIYGFHQMPHKQQLAGELSDMRNMLQMLLDQAAEPKVEQQVQVELTLSVDTTISKGDIKNRILSYLDQSDGITTMSIEIKEEVEIYKQG